MGRPPGWALVSSREQRRRCWTPSAARLALTVDGEATITPTGGGRLAVGDRVVVGTRGDRGAAADI